jgi:hypothetical protein
VSAGSSGAAVVVAAALLDSPLDSLVDGADDCDCVFASVPQEAMVSIAAAATADTARARTRMQIPLSQSL